MGRFALAPHVHLCVDDGCVVFLDLKADRYWALDAAQTAGLGDWIPGWPVPAVMDPKRLEEPSLRLGTILDTFLGRGLIVDERDGKSATPVSIATPSGELLSRPAAPRICAGALTVLAVSTVARVGLRLSAFHRVVARVGARRMTRSGQRGPLDLHRARGLTQNYTVSQLFFLSARDQCLSDSLSLIEYLAWHDIYPDWVFGVQARPFAAHCWVQHDALVFNDTAEHVRTYTPIMIV
ncbi:MAG TPA: lasso peptide biosynthesis B2 protein [Steroidobacteraceae bacterium]|nr:lasso peptide biosynthesis B2 protein [Steroidobacteraceae bacterium]